MSTYEASPTPLARIAELERKIDSLLNDKIAQGSSVLMFPNDQHVATWKSDEHLLLRCLKRMPVVLSAYQHSVELQLDHSGRVEFTIADQPGVFTVVELVSGDAVVCVDQERSELYDMASASLRHIFEIPNPDQLPFSVHSIQKLPYLMPIERGRRWTLFDRGIISHSPIQSSSHSTEVLRIRQQDQINRKVSEMLAHHATELNAIKADLFEIRREIKELLRLSLAVRSVIN